MKTHDDRPLLVPVDFSPHSEAALVFATHLAATLGTPVVVLHVVHDPGEAPGFYAGKRGPDSLARLEDIAGDMMNEFIAKFGEEHPEWSKLQSTQTVLKVGLPVTRILEVADLIDAGMIVMGSRGRTGLSHVLLGSKAEQVARLSPVPVTIVKDDEPNDAST